METLAIADLLRENELAVASLYRECARLFPQVAADFSLLAEEEEFHASLFGRVMKQIETCPESWKTSKITRQTVEVLHKYLQQTLEEVISGKVAPRYALTALKSFELGMTEKRVGSMLVCLAVDCDEDISLIDQGFDRHLKKLFELETKIFGKDSHAEHFKF